MTAPTWVIDLNIYASVIAIFAYVYITLINIEFKRWPWALLSAILAVTAGVYALGYLNIYYAPEKAVFIESVWIRGLMWLIMIGPAAAWTYQASQMTRDERALYQEMLEAKEGAEKIKQKSYRV